MTFSSVSKIKRMEEHYPQLWLDYLMGQCNDQQKLNFETKILHQKEVKKELIEIQTFLQDLHDALIFEE
jgi:hypothetical protein